MNTRTTSRQGSIIAIALVFAMLLGILLYSLLNYGLTERRLNLHHETWAEARYGAESALEFAVGEMATRVQIRSFTPADSMRPSVTPPVLPPASFFAGSRIDYSTLRIIGGRFSAPQTVTIPLQPSADRLAGRTVQRRTARIFAQATAVDPGTGTRTTYWCSTDLQIRRPNWFDSLGDYLPDLEIAPGPNMKTYGDFQTAGNLYYQSNNGLEFWGKVVCGGTLHHGRKAGSGQSSSEGDVSIANTSNTLVSLKQGSWVTSATADFADLSMDLWGGNLLTGAVDAEVPSIAGFGDYTPYSSADQNSNPVHQIIEFPKVKTAPDYNADVEPQKIGAKAGLVIHIPATGAPVAYRYVEDAAGDYDRQNRLTETTSTFRREAVTLPAGLVTSATMTDKRRSATALKMWDVDIGKLRQAINTNEASAQIGGGFDKDSDWNGVVYIEVEAPNNAGVRVHNGEQIPNYGNQSGLTLGTNAPLYVRGNFNADGSLPFTEKEMGQPEAHEPPAALVADAITILSNNWSDSKSSRSLGERRASITEVAAALVGGIVPSKDGKYSGGFENYPRFLEDWNEVVFGYRGAVVALFDSEIATQPWGSRDVYNAPLRRWAYNELFQIDTPDFAPPRNYPNRVGFTEYRSQAEFDAAVAAATATP